MATAELSEKLERRTKINESDESDKPAPKQQHFNVYSEFKEFSLQEIKEFKKIFSKYDEDKNNFIDFFELKLMMEKLDSPQTHLSLKAMIKEVDEDNDGSISFREFMLIFRKARAGELECDGLYQLYSLTEVDVAKEGVGGAKKFFESKIDVQSRDNKFEQEIKQEKELKKKEMEAMKQRRKEFQEKAKMFE